MIRRNPKKYQNLAAIPPTLAEAIDNLLISIEQQDELHFDEQEQVLIQTLFGRLLEHHQYVRVHTAVLAEIERWSWNVVVQNSTEKTTKIEHIINLALDPTPIQKLQATLQRSMHPRLKSVDVINLFQQIYAETKYYVQGLQTYAYRLRLQGVDPEPFLLLIPSTPVHYGTTRPGGTE